MFWCSVVLVRERPTLLGNCWAGSVTIGKESFDLYPVESMTLANWRKCLHVSTRADRRAILPAKLGPPYVANLKQAMVDGP